MTKMIFLLFLVLFFQPGLGACAEAEELWQAANSGLVDIDIRYICVFSGNNKFLGASSAKSVYISRNSGDFWQQVFSLEGEEGEINFIAFDCLNPAILYSATTKGLFVTKNQGRDWQRVFRRVNEQENDIKWLSFDCRGLRIIYLGTALGLYLSSDSGATWRKVRGGLPRSAVRAIVAHPSNFQTLYLANTYGLFKTIDAGQSWERIYVTSHRMQDEENGEEAAEIEEQNLINGIAIDQGAPQKLFLATGSGVLASTDAGATWNKVSSFGLSNDYVNFIVVPAEEGSTVYAATKNGVFEFLSEANTWRKLYQGMIANDVRCLALTAPGSQLFAGTDKGVFRTVRVEEQAERKPIRFEDEFSEVNVLVSAEIINTAEDIENETATETPTAIEEALEQIISSEPNIRQVQEAALRYAEVVHPYRIETLRRNAKLKALLPDVNLDYDKTIYGSTSREFAYAGPRDWGLSLSWDIGDLLFSEQVRLIDSNARLLVQLRDDILNEVTRIYYERRKLQTGLILRPPKSLEEKLNQNLRLEELTANIDALTGGYFSRHIKGKEERW